MPREAFIDHLTIPVRDVAVSRRFYEAALGPFNIETAVIDGAVGFGPSGSVDFFVREGEPAAPVHLAFAAPDRATVDAFHAAALPLADGTTVRLVSARATTPTTTAGMSLTRMATTLRLSAIAQRVRHPSD